MAYANDYKTLKTVFFIMTPTFSASPLSKTYVFINFVLYNNVTIAR